MSKLKLKYFLSIFLVSVLALTLAPVVAEMQFNRLSSEKEVFISEDLQNFHEELFIADLHADSLLWKRNLRQKSYRGHVDIPRLREGNMGFQYFTVVTKSPKNLNIKANKGDSDNITTLAMAQLWPPKTWYSLFERAVYQAELLQKYVAKDGKMILIKNRSDLENFLRKRRMDPRWMGVSLGLEGAHAIQDNLEEHFKKLVGLGYTMMGPVHLFDNEIAGSMQGFEKGGLSDKGERFVALANQYNVSIDLAHASIPTIKDVLKLSTKPLIVSHTGLRGHCPNNRNLPDDLAKEIVSKGGLIGIGFWPTAMCGNEVDNIVSAMRYAVDLLGVDNVALGSDFDGAVAVPFTVNKINYLSQRLMDHGFSKSEIQKIMGANALAFMAKNLP